MRGAFDKPQGTAKIMVLLLLGEQFSANNNFVAQPILVIQYFNYHL